MSDDIWRFGTSANLAVASAGGASVSTAVFESQTYAVQLNYPGSTSSTGGLRVSFVGAADTTSPLLPANWPFVVKVTPGQRVNAISNDAGTISLNVVQLTK